MKKFIDICQFVLVLFGMMICGLFLTTMIGLLPLKWNAMQWCIIAGQNILAFIIPAILTWKFCFKTSPLHAIEADKAPSLRMIGIAILIYVVGIPVLNQIVYWNQEINLPEYLSGFEQWCRQMEEQAEELTKGLINTTDLLPTIINLLLIGILTGIGEEFFFRGALQRMLIWCKVNPHVAIWTAATVFSALHFQFFGFVPRLLLGAFFGYLYWWSASIWVNAFAHALNNSLVIVSTWCINKGLISEEFDMMGVSEGSVPLLAIISAIAVGFIISFFISRGVLVGARNLPPAIPQKS
ncbi:MAG: CPBP family intramembrane metalloprotease [Muribaculaceae bacterium]|nr:CPBP family intramembrane metalloprotease [Muribaculaceae bacterium]